MSPFCKTVLDGHDKTVATTCTRIFPVHSSFCGVMMIVSRAVFGSSMMDCPCIQCLDVHWYLSSHFKYYSLRLSKAKGGATTGRLQDAVAVREW